MERSCTYGEPLCQLLAVVTTREDMGFQPRIFEVIHANVFDDLALVQLNGDIFLFYNKSLGDLNVEKFTHQTPSKS